jgi:predicted metalloenzyme YecM
MFVKDHPLFSIAPFNNPSAFIAHLHGELQATGIDFDLFDYEMDHICWRCADNEEYIIAGQAAITAGATLLVEGMIGGRPITTLKLDVPIVIIHDDTEYFINSLEIPAPKPGKGYPSGWEHVECVICEGSGHPSDKSPLLDFLDKYPDYKWNKDALTKSINSDISLSFPASKAYENSQPVVVKFHCCPLPVVIEFEKAQTKLGKKAHAVVPIPAEGFPSLQRSLIPPMGSDQKGGIFSPGKGREGIA